MDLQAFCQAPWQAPATGCATNLHYTIHIHMIKGSERGILDLAAMCVSFVVCDEESASARTREAREREKRTHHS